MPQEAIQELVALAAPFWAGEAEVVRSFFSVPREKREHIRWLQAQCYKEFFGALDGDPGGLVRGPIERLHQMYDPLFARGEGQAAFLHVAEELYEEFHHYSVLAALLEKLEGRPVPPAELRPCAEDARLTALRRGFYQGDGDVGRAACKFTEGGGMGMFIAGMELQGGRFEEEVAAAFGVIYGDELGHMQSGARRLAEVAHTPTDWLRATHIVRVVSSQRVRMRNDMFGWPLSEQRLAEIDAGSITPLSLDILRGVA
jgi:hypothetical protein